jgi:ABC-type multidrug transport system fused ATPase/permease subunit
MSSKETWILVSGIAATLQLCRLSFDLISTASQKDAKVSERLETATREELRESIKSSSRFSFLTRKRSSKHETQQSLQPQNHLPQASIAESSSPVLTLGKDEESMPMDGESRRTLYRNEQMVIYASLIGNASLLVYFFVACLLQGLQENSGSLSSTTALGCLTASFFLSTVMCIRDWKRERFSNVQRVLYSLSALLLALGIIFRVALWKKNHDGSESLGALDIASLVILVLYAAFVLVECKVIPPLHLFLKDHNAKKARLSYRKVLRVLKPYFWPDATASSATLNRIRALSTWACVVSAKACSLTAPIFLGKASTQLAMFQWRECIRNVIFYCLLNLGNTIFREAQSLVYLRVAQAAFVQLSELSFSHLHSLSLDWHLRKKLGEVIRSMDRGILACDTLVKFLFLWLVPALAECILVAVIFATYFDYLPLAVNIFYFVFAYMVLTILLTLWRKKFRKQVAKSDNDWHDIATDSLINFETVKYFTSEDYEMKKFGAAVETYQQGSVNVTASLSMLNISQAILLQACLAVSLSLATLAIQDRFECCVAQGCATSDVECCTNLSDVCPGMEIGDFVAVLSYTINLFVPLNFLGSIYNAIVMAIVDLTNLSELLAENPDVRDAKDAVDLPDSNADDPNTVVEFENVHFHYPTQPESSGLKGVSFKMKKGTTTAIVGSVRFFLCLLATKFTLFISPLFLPLDRRRQNNYIAPSFSILRCNWRSY